MPSAPFTGAPAGHGGPLTPGILYGEGGGGVDGTLLHGGSVLSPSPAAAPPFHGPSEGAPSAAAQGTHPPIFYKLEFSTYDSSVDPLNWLNHYEQFFRGQRTLPSDRTWLASYHLTDVA